jgi:hypothetical protein
MSKITEKIAKLLALAESPYEEEAKAALLQARRLMAEHKLMPEDIEPQENKKVIQECVGITCTKLSSPWTVYLSTLIAAHYCCRPYRSSVHGSKVSEIGFIGMEDDFKLCKLAFLYAYDCIASRCRQIRTQKGDVQFLRMGLLPRAVCRFPKARGRTSGMGIGHGRAAGGRGCRFQNEAEQL